MGVKQVEGGLSHSSWTVDLQKKNAEEPQKVLYTNTTVILSTFFKFKYSLFAIKFIDISIIVYDFLYFDKTKVS